MEICDEIAIFRRNTNNNTSNNNVLSCTCGLGTIWGAGIDNKSDVPGGLTEKLRCRLRENTHTVSVAGTILGRFSIIYFRGLGLRIGVRVWVWVRDRVWVWVWFGLGLVWCYGQGKFRVRVRIRVTVVFGLGL